MATIAGFPYWELEFNDNGRLAAPDHARRCITEVTKQKITDLFVFSHGWNNDHTLARELYRRFFEVARRVLTARSGPAVGSGVGIVGVLWPSILFPDDQPIAPAGGAAGVGDTARSDDPIAELKKVFPDQSMILDELGRLLDEQPESIDELRRFQALLVNLAPLSSTDEGNDNSGVLNEDPEKIFDELSALAPQRNGMTLPHLAMDSKSSGRAPKKHCESSVMEYERASWPRRRARCWSVYRRPAQILLRYTGLSGTARASRRP
jgi:hypothetical protein